MTEATPDTKQQDPTPYLAALRTLAEKAIREGVAGYPGIPISPYLLLSLLDRIEELERENARLIETYLKTPEGVVVTKVSEDHG